MGGVPGAEERGRIGGAAARAGPGHVILSLGPLPGMASPFTLQQGTQDGARAWQARLWPQLAPGTRLKMTGRASGQPEIISPTPCSPNGRPWARSGGLAKGHTGIGSASRAPAAPSPLCYTPAPWVPALRPRSSLLSGGCRLEAPGAGPGPSNYAGLVSASPSQSARWRVARGFPSTGETRQTNRPAHV